MLKKVVSLRLKDVTFETTFSTILDAIAKKIPPEILTKLNAQYSNASSKDKLKRLCFPYTVGVLVNGTLPSGDQLPRLQTIYEACEKKFDGSSGILPEKYQIEFGVNEEPRSVMEPVAKEQIYEEVRDFYKEIQDNITGLLAMLIEGSFLIFNLAHGPQNCHSIGLKKAEDDKYLWVDTNMRDKKMLIPRTNLRAVLFYVFTLYALHYENKLSHFWPIGYSARVTAPKKRMAVALAGGK
ncbi:hypothetical protein HOC37_03200 [bacterium]|nr:hypothetical protein [bacterium]MBT3580968.1 hypothetical protein [bacterium]MBT4551974.1 hypothetical protein [bacterium]MBT5988244.1 hypothetical protein [bacterium]MBT7088225.1 hypothetical protein [bacterium]